LRVPKPTNPGFRPWASHSQSYIKTYIAVKGRLWRAVQLSMRDDSIEPLTGAVRVFGCPKELAERLEASGYDIPASEIEAGRELHLPCLVKVGKGRVLARSRPMTGYRIHPQFRVREAKASLARISA
jgi:hypothetical protein